MTPEDYNNQFFKLQHSESYISAKEVLPLIFEIIKPRSVLDVGCGSGAWLKVYEELTGSKDYKGIDGSYVDSSSLLIELEHFIEKDLSKEFNLGERFDLVISLEVAEHLDKKSAEPFINSLVKHADIILFSAAIPGQEGTKHYNEQFPEYWEAIFNQFGYRCFDILRDKIWNNSKIPFWYKQNILLYISENKIEELKPLLLKYNINQSRSLTRIHPELWSYKNNKLSYYENVANSLKRFISHKFLKRRLYK